MVPSNSNRESWSQKTKLKAPNVPKEVTLIDLLELQVAMPIVITGTKVHSVGGAIH